MDVNTREFRQLVGKRIKAERERTALTQKEFAKKIGISNQTYNNLENGIGSLKLEHLYKISDKCGCDMGYLLGECDNRTYEATDISKVTGLSEEAVDILKTVKSNKTLFYRNDSISDEVRDYLEDNESEKVFVEVINHIIENFSLEARLFQSRINLVNEINPEISIGHIRDTNFPIIKLVSYICKYRKYHPKDVNDDNDDGFDFNKFMDILMLNPLESLSSASTDEEAISSMRRKLIRKEIEYDRVIIQEAFSEFLRGYFVKGVTDGK